MVEPTRVTLVPHTHWDREWYEPFSVFSERLVAMMDTLLGLTADGFPHFHSTAVPNGLGTSSTRCRRDDCLQVRG
jgi:alpha-mannosidase